MKAIIIGCFLFMISVTIAIAQTGEKELYLEYKKVDTRMNIVYNKLKTKLGKAEKLVLINAQKKWLKSRKSNCNSGIVENDGTGPLENKMRIDCEIEITKKRIEEIKRLIRKY